MFCKLRVVEWSGLVFVEGVYAASLVMIGAVSLCMLIMLISEDAYRGQVVDGTGRIRQAF